MYSVHSKWIRDTQILTFHFTHWINDCIRISLNALSIFYRYVSFPKRCLAIHELGLLHWTLLCRPSTVECRNCNNHALWTLSHCSVFFMNRGMIVEVIYERLLLHLRIEKLVDAGSSIFMTTLKEFFLQWTAQWVRLSTQWFRCIMFSRITLLFSWKTKWTYLVHLHSSIITPSE